MSLGTFGMRWIACCAVALACAGACAQERGEGALDKSPPKGMTAEEVIQRFTAKEKQWKTLREQYTFRQETRVETLNGNEVMGEYRQVADIHYQNGTPVKNVVLGPQPSITLSKEDLQDLESRATFTISTDELPIYNLTYAGQQKVDELHCYVFDVAPKTMEKGKRYFQGRIWVDDQDFQIVKNSGKAVPDIRIVKKKKKAEENLFPQFTTWREQVAEKFWFPTFSSADDVLHFQTSDMRIKEVLKFTGYKRLGTAAAQAR
jgi:outer membrane lipoprotein-sorting protein